MKIAWYYPLVRLTARGIFATTRVKVTGLHNWPEGGPVLVCANHIGFADPPLLGLSLPRNPVHFLAKKELFRNRIFAQLLKGSGAIPLNRGGVSGASFKLASRVLKKEGALIIFPEGRRNPDGVLSAALPGAGYLAASLKVPVLPVAITGTEKIRGRFWFFKLHRVNIVIGKPFRLVDEESKRDKMDLNAYGDRIMQAIAELLPSESRGIYGKEK